MGAYETINLSIAILSILAIFFDIIARKLFQKVLDFLNYKEILNQPESTLVVTLHQKVAELRKIGIQISEEKVNLKSAYFNLVKDDSASPITNLHKVHKSFVDLQDHIKSRFKTIGDENKARCDQIQEMVINLGNDVAKLKKQIEQTEKILNLSKFAQLEKSCSFSEAAAQTEESSCIFSMNKASDGSPQEEECVLLKLGVLVAIIESEKLKKDVVLRIYSNFGKKYKNTKTIITANWGNMIEEITNGNSLFDKMHHVKQTVLGIHILLHQQYLDGQTIRETLQFYHRKFKKSIQRNGIRKNKHNTCFRVALDSLQNAHAISNVRSIAFKDTSMDVTQKLDHLTKMVTQSGSTTKLLNNAEDITCSLEKNVHDLITNSENLSDKINGDYSQKIRKLSEELLAPRELLYVFYKTLGDLRTLADGSTLPPKPISSDTQIGKLESKQQYFAPLASYEKTKANEAKNSNAILLRKIKTAENFAKALNEILICNKQH